MCYNLSPVEATTGRETPALGECVEEWLESCVRRGLKVSTVRGYRTLASLYIPGELRQMPVDQVTSAELDGLYDVLLRQGRRNGGGLKPITVRKVHLILRGTLERAVKRGAVGANAARGAEAPRARACRAPIFPVWSPEELQRFLQSARAHPYYAAFHVAASTGLRRGELLGLRWCDVDLDNALVQVLQTVILVRADVLIDTPKSPTSRRRVDLDRRTARVLSHHLADVERTRGCAAGALKGSTELIFTRKGGPVHPALFSYWFQRQVELSGVRRIRLHDLRHTHATHALQAGVHPKVVSERLGHSSITITLDTYSHVLPSMQREAAERVAALIRA
jgi:integrase